MPQIWTIINNQKESNIGDVDSNGDGNGDDGGNDEYVDGDEMMMIMRLVDDEDVLFINLPSRSMSPLSSRVSHTVATCFIIIILRIMLIMMFLKKMLIMMFRLIFG